MAAERRKRVVEPPAPHGTKPGPGETIPESSDTKPAIGETKGPNHETAEPPTQEAVVDGLQGDVEADGLIVHLDLGPATAPRGLVRGLELHEGLGQVLERELVKPVPAVADADEPVPQEEHLESDTASSGQEAGHPLPKG